MKLRHAWGHAWGHLRRWWYHRRSHLLDLRNEADRYRGGYLDRDRAMLYACFNLLRRYVEEENPFQILDWEEKKERRDARYEIRILYLWWVAGRIEERKRAELLRHGSGCAYVEETVRLDERDQAMLERLAKVRTYLWT